MMKSMLLSRLLHSSNDSNLAKSETMSFQTIGEEISMSKVISLEEKFK